MNKLKPTGEVHNILVNSSFLDRVEYLPAKPCASAKAPTTCGRQVNRQAGQ